jgi:YesN/AraC family two-component response regulator
MKESMHKLYHSTFFTKLLGSFLAILILASSFIVVNTSLSYRHTKQQYLLQLQQRLEASASVVGSQIMMAFRLGSTLFQEYSTIMFFKPRLQQTPESQSEVWRVQELIKKDENALNPLVHSIFTYFPSDDVVLTSAGTYDKDFYFDSICAYESYNQVFWDTAMISAGQRIVLPETVLTTRSGPVKVLPVLTVSRLSGELVVHVCNLSVLYIRKLLSIQGVIDSNFRIVDNSGKLLLGSSNLLPEDEHALVLQASNEEVGWTFSEFVSQAYVDQWLKEAYTPSVLLVVLLVFSGFFLVLFLSVRLYRPIGDMKQLITNPKLGGRFDELSTIRKEMEQLLTKEDYHQQQEQAYQLEFARHSLNLLLHGLQTHDLARTTAILESQRGFVATKYVSCAVLIEFLPRFYQTHDQDSEETFRHTLPALLRSLLEQRVPVVVIALDKDFYEMVVNIESFEAKAMVKQLLIDQQSVFVSDSQYYCVSFGRGNPVDSLNELAQSHNQALAALQLREPSRSFQLIDYSQLPPKKKVAFSFYDQKGIVNNIETGNRELLSKYLVGLVEKNEQRAIDADNMTELYRQILLVGRRSVEEHGYKVEQLPRYLHLTTLLTQALDVDTLKNVKGELCRLFTDIQDLVCTQRSRDPGDGVIGDVKLYLEQHFHQVLSLEMVADHFGLTAKYLSRLFKEETNENFSDYLVGMRVSHAKILLARTNEKIGDIASSVGIESRATFLRTFQKVEGISPSEYRRLTALRRQEGLDA